MALVLRGRLILAGQCCSLKRRSIVEEFIEAVAPGLRKIGSVLGGGPRGTQDPREQREAASRDARDDREGVPKADRLETESRAAS